MSYGLRAGVTFCAVDDAWFFLDLPNDRYACLVGAAAAGFGSLVRGHEVEGPLGALAPLAAMLEEDGAMPQPFSREIAPSEDLAESRRSSLGLRADAALALYAAIRTVARHPLERTMMRLKARKRDIAPPQGNAHLPEIAEAFRFAGMIFGVQDRCLPLSVACANLLARRHVRGDLVFGVKDRPFEAHCWVQVGACVVNDTVERVHAFTPILSI